MLSLPIRPNLLCDKSHNVPLFSIEPGTSEFQAGLWHESRDNCCVLRCGEVQKYWLVRMQSGCVGRLEVSGHLPVACRSLTGRLPVTYRSPACIFRFKDEGNRLVLDVGTSLASYLSHPFCAKRTHREPCYTLCATGPHREPCYTVCVTGPHREPCYTLCATGPHREPCYTVCATGPHHDPCYTVCATGPHPKPRHVVFLSVMFVFLWFSPSQQQQQQQQLRSVHLHPEDRGSLCLFTENVMWSRRKQFPLQAFTLTYPLPAQSNQVTFAVP